MCPQFIMYPIIIIFWHNYLALLPLSVADLPLTFISDYEKASINALSSVFPRVEHQGCLFHFAQSLYRKVVELGLKSQYHNDKSFNLKIRCYTALAILPVLDVIDGFDEITEDEIVPEEFITYFQSTYIGIFRGRGPNRKRSTPPFPVDM